MKLTLIVEFPKNYCLFSFNLIYLNGKTGVNILNKIIILSALILISLTLQAQIPVAVLELEGKGLTEMEASILTDRLRNELFQTGRFRVIERDKMSDILNEQGFQLSECTSTECMVEIGRMLGVEQMVGGSVSKFGSMFSISARMISVETGEIYGTATYDHEGRIEDLLKFGMKAVANKLSGFSKGASDRVTSSPIAQQAEPTPPPSSSATTLIAQTQEAQEEKPETAPIINKPESVTKAPGLKNPRIMLRSELGVYGLSNQDAKDNFKGTTGMVLGSYGVFNFKNIPNFANIGALAGIQIMALVLTPKDDRSQDFEYSDVYVVSRLGLQASSNSSSALNISVNFGYAAVSFVRMMYYQGTSYGDAVSETSGGIFTDLIFSLRPFKSINLTLDGGYGMLVAGKKNVYGGSKFIIGGSLNF
jgi:TolB-like protein